MAKSLARVQGEFPSVQVGSYPDTSSSSSFRVRITFESADRELVEKVGLPLSAIVHVHVYRCI